jgi:hypothetical protein
MYSSSTCFKSSTVSKIYRSIWEAWRTLVSAELCWIPILIKLAVLLLKHSELGYFPFSRSLFYHCLYDCTIQIIHDDIIKFLNVLFFFFSRTGLCMDFIGAAIKYIDLLCSKIQSGSCFPGWQRAGLPSTFLILTIYQRSRTPSFSL